MNQLLSDLQRVLSSYYDTLVSYIPRIAVAIIIVALGYLLASCITRIIKRRLYANAEDTIAATFLTKVAKILLVIGVILVALQVAGLGSFSAALLGAVGASTLILGFAFKDIGENFIAGIILAFSRPFRIGDSVQINEHFGKVKELKFRYTHLKTFDGKDVFVPNADVMTNSLTNYTSDGYIRLEFVVGIAYESDIQEAITIIDAAVFAHEKVINTAEHQSFSCIDELATSTVNIKVRFWIETENYRRESLETRSAVMREVKQNLIAAGVNLPADIQELKIYGTEPSFPIEIIRSAENGKSGDLIKGSVSPS